MASRVVRMLRWNFVRVHYAYVLSLSVLGMIILYSAKNMSAIDAFFQAVSAATVTGLNTRDHKDMKLYQQLVLYFWPLLGQLQFINTIVVLVRLHWFEKKFKDIVRLSRQRTLDRNRPNVEEGNNGDSTNSPSTADIRVLRPVPESGAASSETTSLRHRGSRKESDSAPAEPANTETSQEAAVNNPPAASPELPDRSAPGHITFSPDTYNKPSRGRALRIPGPREFEKGHRVEEVEVDSDAELEKMTTREDPSAPGPSEVAGKERLPTINRILSRAASVEQVASSAFILGEASRPLSRSRSRSQLGRTTSALRGMPYLSYTPTIGRNSLFLDLTPEQRDELGGIEYRSLRLLAKITGGYYLLFNLLGAILLVIWIHKSNIKYRGYLEEIAVNPTWWAFYSSMTTFNNLGFTLTPDSMIHFRDATFPMLLMTVLMWIGNTAYPCLLRLLIWTAFKLAPKNSAIREPLNFLLDHPRRCYTLLFPSGPTWALFATLVLLNGIDVVLFMILDLHNSEVTTIRSGWHRFCAALFQSTSTRTTGTVTFSVSKLHPAVQLSIVVMMYISAYPIAMSVRKTNTYEESSLGIYSSPEEEVDENKRVSYLGLHIKKQLAFDLWYVFLGVFIVVIAEGGKVESPEDPDFSVFAIIFECVSAYGNVGMSMGHRSVNTALAGKCTVVSKLVFCALMIRGRHRELPYELDRAIILPRERHLTDDPLLHGQMGRMRRYYTH
ncbi:hypothetical protein VTO42DRAFT_9030 [Malbranchea cinnamomea]